MAFDVPTCLYESKSPFCYQNELSFLVPQNGGDKRDRTADLLNAIQALSQLSYTPVFCCFVAVDLLNIADCQKKVNP